MWGMLHLTDPCAKSGTLSHSWWQNLELASDLIDMLCLTDWDNTQ
jgi:hypothetical protein